MCCFLAVLLLGAPQTLDEFRLRDPFVLPVAEESVYYMFGTGREFPVYTSRDLVHWEGPELSFQQPDDFHSINFWAPEVHRHNGKYYMFATLKLEGKPRATHILVADRPAGPYAMQSKTPVTPPDWYCLDGTLHIEDGRPWMVLCHEWVQTGDGEMCAIPLSSDLKSAAGEPILLFKASDAAWVSEAEAREAVADAERYGPEVKPGQNRRSLVTDGPFLHRTGSGALVMLWSTFGAGGYRVVLARSESGKIRGPWVQQPEPVWQKDGGHAMLFRRFDGQLMMAFHQPNRGPDERPRLVEVEERGNSLAIKSRD